MREGSLAAVVVLCFATTTQLGAQTLTGKWEGVISERARDVVFTVDFASGTLDALGQKSRVAVTVTGTKVDLRGTDGSFVFSGARDGEVIAGTFSEGNDRLPFRMEREPDLPAPHGRAEAWQQDLDYALRKMDRLDRSFTPAARRQFDARIRELRSAAARLDDAHLTVGLAKAVALAGNAHTRLYLVRNRIEVRRLPVRVWWFGNRLYVIRATLSHQRLVGCEVKSIAGTGVRRLRELVAPVYAGNPSWIDYMSTYTMTSPEILYGLDVARQMDHIRWDLVCGGKTTGEELEPMALSKSPSPLESWWDLAPSAPATPGMVGIELKRVPVYLRHPDRYYWFEYLPDARLLYFQFNRAANDPQQTIAEFREQLLAAIAQHAVNGLVIDLRFNTGGNGDIGRELMERLQKEVGARKVFVITGRATFSAGLFHAVQWKHWGKAVLVGELPGDGLDFWSEGGNAVLPRSGLTLHFANARHCYSTRKSDVPCFAQLPVQTLRPDLPATSSFEQYAAGRDASMDAILASLRSATPGGGR